MTYTVYEGLGQPPFYYLMNFNDFPSALVLLFQQMIVNNWFVVVNMMSLLVAQENLVRLFFVSFWVVVVLVLINIMVAIVLEIHGSLQ